MQPQCNPPVDTANTTIPAVIAVVKNVGKYEGNQKSERFILEIAQVVGQIALNAVCVPHDSNATKKFRTCKG